MRETGRAGLFTGRVAALFGTQVVAAGFNVINGVLLARLLGPAAKGDYYLLVLVPSTVTILALLGLPQAFGFFAARGRTRGLVTKSVLLTMILSGVALVATLALLPLLLDTVMRGLASGQILIALVAVPLSLSAAFTTGIVMGRQAVRWYASVSVASSMATTLLILLVLGGLGASVNGAVVVYLIALSVHAIGFAVGAWRVSKADTGAGSASYRELLRYGLPFYPTNLTVHFSYRVDAYLIAALIADPSESLGYYSMAVAMAELVFFFPNAVSTLFFPHVASSSREDSDRQVAMVSRVTFFVTGVVALLMIPAVSVLVWTLLPAFGPSIPPFLALLPGVVTLSIGKVVGGYMTGINRPDVNALVSITSLALNVVANLLLIPRFGIVGAATASLVSYSFSSLVTTAIAARITRTPMASFWVPNLSDVAFTMSTAVGLVRSLRGRTANGA